LRMGYQPHPPKVSIHGHIIRVVDGVSQIGQYSIVVIDRGLADGIETGNVLEIVRSGQTRLYEFSGEEIINLPNEIEGYMLVFRPYERVSFALVMKAIRAIQLTDAVTIPH